MMPADFQKMQSLNRLDATIGELVVIVTIIFIGFLIVIGLIILTLQRRRQFTIWDKY